VDLLVYIALAKHADGEGVCWPSMATIGKLARCARETVARSITHLEARGYLKRTARFRPDGGVTSNAYRLMPMEAQKYPSVVQEDTPRRPGRLPPVAQDDANYTNIELEPSKERTDKAPRPTQTPLPAPDPSHEIAPVSLSALLERIKHEAQARGAPPCFIAGGWFSEIGVLVKSGIPEDELVQAFTACIETAPERVTFFPRDFLKWRKVSRERRAGEQRRDNGREERQAREEEREQILRERDDPYWQAQIEASIAQLPWRRVRG